MDEKSKLDQIFLSYVQKVDKNSTDFEEGNI
jgi:hypothetical protein